MLDAVGAGELPDAAQYGDEGSDTLGNVARAVGGLDLPSLEALGLGNVEPLEGCPPQPGAVIVDVAIDQGGCIETARPTTHSDPVYEVDGIIHYCVANMPGGVPVTSTKSLTNATLPYVEAIADHGLAESVARDPSLGRGVNVLDGKITHEAVAEAHGLDYTPLADVLPLAPV